MNRVRIIFFVFVLLTLIGLSSCAGQSTSNGTEPTSTAHTYPPPMYDPEDVVASLTSVPDEAESVATAEPTKAPQTEPTEVVAAESEVDNCLKCHTDQQTLIDTADPVAEVVSENEGEG